MSRENATPLARVCQRLDGIPLAIELAAARVRVLTVDQIAARLDDRFRLLTGGSRTALRRQQTLRALIDWSHDLLSEAERTLFRRLAVFAGGWSLEAAEAVCSGAGLEGYEVLDLLTGLVDKSLVGFEGQGEEKRYRFLETVRAYAGEKLFEGGEARLMRDQHRDWCLALAERAEPELYGPATPVWLGRLEADYANIRAALEWCLETDLEAGLRLAGSLWLFWMQRDLMEGRRWLDAILTQAPESSAARGKALLGAGFLYRAMPTLSQARSLTEQSLAIARATGDRRLAGWALHNLGCIALMSGDHVNASAILEESVAACREAGDTLGVGVSLRDLGHLARVAGDYDRAAILYGESLALLRIVGHRTNVSWTLQGIGWLARQQNEPARARAAFHESLTLALKDGTILTNIGVLHALGELERSVGNYDAAEANFKDDLADLKKHGMTEFSGYWLYSFGTLVLQKGYHAHGVRLAAAASAELLEPTNTMPADVAEHVAAVEAARAALGEAAFAAAWSEGQAMTLDQAIAHALEEKSVP